MAAPRQYWVVSPNVRNSSRTVDKWRRASVRWKAAFMGWGPDQRDHKALGYNFAHRILPGDVILIARRHLNEPEIVGFGTVVGEFKTGLRGFKPPESFGALRKLRPFQPFSRAPLDLPFVDVLNQTTALHKLHPETIESHKRLCRWLDRKLAEKTVASNKGQPRNVVTHVQLGPLPSDTQLEYRVRTLASSRRAKRREAELILRYREWIGRQERKLRFFKNTEICCDAYEEARRNLIEAKCSERREYIRMAVGQLLDYAFHATQDLGNCRKAVLLPNKPSSPVVDWLSSLDISVIWEDHRAFLDNANGRFT